MSLNSFWNLDSLAAHVRGTWISMPAMAFRRSMLNGLSTDSRAVEAGQIFLALKGEKFDGHDFLAQAISRGVSALIVSDERAWRTARSTPGAERIAVVRVDDTGVALLDLGASYRRCHAATFVAVGGSNGKTSTVRLLSAALTGQQPPARRIHSSQKSFNNSVGVPITILSAPTDSECVICEVGTNAPGELAPLSELVEPDLAVITSLGREHLEGLGSLEGVAREEASLVRGVRDGGTIVVNADSPELLAGVSEEVDRAAGAGRKVRVITFGVSGIADIRVGDIKQTLAGSTFTIASRIANQPGQAPFSIPLLGAHNTINAAGAIAIARLLGVADSDVSHGLMNTAPAPMRLQRVDALTAGSPIRFVNDAYNANPESMIAAISTLKEVVRSLPVEAGSRLVVVLGDMLELGPNAVSLHNEVLSALLGANVADEVYLIGPLWKATWESRTATQTSLANKPKVTLVPSFTTDSADQIAHELRPGDCVLLKGSRSMGLERVLAAAQRLSPASSPASSVEPKPVSAATVRS